MLSIRAIFDGKVFVPEEPVSLPRDARCTIVLTRQSGAKAAGRRERRKQVSSPQRAQEGQPSALEAFLAKGRVAGPWPKDFASEVDHYLYALPKARGKVRRATTKAVKASKTAKTTRKALR